ncbi:MAG: GumC domain-containing protein [Pirellulaceae bacterium]
MSIPMLRKRDNPDVRGFASVQLPSPMYGMTIVSLAMFFIGLIVWRVPVEAYLVVSEVGRRGVSQGMADTPSPEVACETWDSQQLAAIRQALADAIRFADARATNRQPDRSLQVAQERIESVGSRLKIAARRLRDSDHRISISFAGEDPIWSLALVENLTRDCLVSTGHDAQSPPIATRLLRDIRWRIAQARHYERKARYEMESLIDAQLAYGRGSAGSGAPGGPAASEVAASGGAPEAQPVVEPNPQWQFLQNELASMTDQLEMLLSQLTPNHPQVRDLTLQMEAVRQQLDQTPVYHVREVSQAVASAPMDGDASSTDASLAAHKLEMADMPANLGGDYENVRQTHEEAVRDREAAEQKLAALVTEQVSNMSRGKVESRWLITPPTVLGRIGGRPSARRVGTIGMLALLCGISMAWLIGSLKGLRRVNSVADLEQTLLIPVVGQLSLDPVPQAVSRLARRSQIVRGVTQLMEISLILMLVVFLIGALEGSSVAQFLRHDPFATIPETIVQAVQSWF